MKILTQITFVLVLALMGITNANAQCSSCCVNTSLDSTGFSPVDSVQPCVIVGTPYATTLQFKNFSSIDGAALGFPGFTLEVDSIRLDSMPNAQSFGFSYACATEHGDCNCVIYKGENACIRLSGTITGLSDTVFPIEIYATVYSNLGAIPVTPSLLASAGIEYRAFVVTNSSNCTNVVDTSINICTGIANIADDVDGFSVSPNPFSGSTNVSFTATQNDVYTLTVYNMIGEAVYEEQVTATPGRNVVAFNRGDIQNGVYFMSLGNGQSWVTQKVIISE